MTQTKIVAPLRFTAFRASALALLGLSLLATACANDAGPAPAQVTRLDPPAGAGAMAPNLVPDTDGALMTWIEPAAAGHALRIARFRKEDGWTEASTMVSSDQLFANWADFPGVVRGLDGSLVGHWLEKSGSGSYAYDVSLVTAASAGEAWRTIGKAHNDGVKAEHGFVSMTPEEEAVRVFWLDGRSMNTEAADGDGAMTLRTALVRDGVVSAGELLDPRVCDCCQTSATRTADGSVVVYRDRTEDEVRDIQIIRRTRSGWSTPRPVHQDGWVVPGCPVNGPSIASFGSGSRSLAVAWFTAAANQPKVKIAFSHDAGATFEPPITIDSSAPLGRVSIALTEEDEAVVGWLAAGDGERASIRLSRAHADGGVGAPLTIATTTSSRAGGFPRMIRSGEGLLVAWTDTGEPSHVRAALVPLSMVPEPTLSAQPGSHMIGAPSTGRAWDRLEGSLAPEYSAATADGGQMGLADMRGQVVLVNLWATWCVPCRTEIPVLSDLHRLYAADGLLIVGISVDVDLPPADLFAFVATEKIPYLILHDAHDRASSVFTGQQMLPASFLFDREGRLAWKRIGMVRKDDPELTGILQRVLAGSGGTSTKSRAPEHAGH